MSKTQEKEFHMPKLSTKDRKAFKTWSLEQERKMLFEMLKLDEKGEERSAPFNPLDHEQTK